MYDDEVDECWDIYHEFLSVEAWYYQMGEQW
jgi:hypothetical protein